MTSPPTVPQVSVRGEALVVVEPEVADLGVTVRVQARDRETALERCRDRQDEVSAVVRAAGDAVETAETTGVAVYAEPRRSGRGDPVATVHTRLTVGRLDAVGELVVALGRIDDVEVTGPSWGLRPDSPAHERVRLAAIADAVRRARSYAAAFGAELTGLLQIADPGASGGGFRVAREATAMAFDAAGLQLDLTPARQEVHGTVEVRFAMSTPDQEVFRG
jgi:uncharacterized protein YggE